MNKGCLKPQSTVDTSVNTVFKESGKSETKQEKLNEYSTKLDSGVCRSSTGGYTLNHQHILYLQRTIGNRAVGRLVQAKLKIGQPGDKYEREADRVAEKIISIPETENRQKPT
jgi:hypothetical protein